MATRAHVPLVRVWSVAVAVFLAAVLLSRALTRASTSYWVGLVGLLAIGVALIMSWRGLGDPGVHSPDIRRALRGLVVAGAILWLLAMLFPFL